MKTIAAALALAAAFPAFAQGEAAFQPSAAYGKAEGLLPGMVIGPKLSLLRVPAPGFGLEAKFQNTFGLSLDVNFIPTVTLDDVSAGYTDVALGAKWYPWRGAFFLGASLGRRTFEASAEDDVAGFGTLEAKAEVTSTYLAPGIGWRWVARSGFFMGMDLGYQIILSSETKLDIPIPLEGQQEAQDVRDAGDDLGELGFPIVTLLQLGWFF